MKKLGTIIVIAFLMCACAVTQALAAEDKGAMPMKSDTRQTMKTDQGDKKSMRYMYKADDIIGMDVKSKDGEDIGSIDQILIDRNGNVRFLVIAHGGVLGIGDKLVPIPWNAFDYNTQEKALMVNKSKKEIEKAPALSDYSEMDNLAMERDVYSYYGPYPGYQAHYRVSEMKEGEKGAEKALREPVTDRSYRYRYYGYAPYGQPGARVKGYYGNDMRTRFGGYKMSDIIGLPVKNGKGEKLGSIDDVIVTDDQDIKYVLLSHGGVLGIGDKLIPIPWQAIDINGAEEVALLDISKEKLEKAPNFEEKQRVDFDDPQWQTEVNSYYGVKAAPMKESKQ